MSPETLEPLRRYFEGERHAGMLAAALGVASVAFAIWAFRGAGAFRAMWIPMAIVGVLQLGIGVGLVVKTGPQVAALEAGLEKDHAAALSTETARMDRVDKNFTVIKIVEIALMVLSAAAIMGMKSKPTVVAVAMALLVEAAVMLAFDVFAEARGQDYLAWLRAAARG